MEMFATIINWLKRFNVILFTVSVLIAVSAVIWLNIGTEIGFAAQETGTGSAQPMITTGESTSFKGWGLLAAALSTGLSTIAAGVAVSIVGSAAMGAVAERPEVMGRSIIFVGLAEGIAIYGLIISIMILGKI